MFLWVPLRIYSPSDSGHASTIKLRCVIGRIRDLPLSSCSSSSPSLASWLPCCSRRYNRPAKRRDARIAEPCQTVGARLPASRGYTRLLTDRRMGVVVQRRSGPRLRRIATGGWPYSILSYIEQGQVRDLGKGVTGNNSSWQPLSIQAHQTPISSFHCPSRRTAGSTRILERPKGSTLAQRAKQIAGGSENRLRCKLRRRRILCFVGVFRRALGAGEL